MVGRVGVVARGDGRVGGEDGAPADGLERVVLGRGARQLERGERGVALVEVHDAGLDAERVQRPHAADAEQQVLAQAHVGVAHVEARGDPAVGDVVLRPVGVEQQQRHAAHVDPPDLRDQLALAPERDRDGDRLAVVARDERARDPVGVRVDPVLVLPARGVDALAEVAVAVHQADRDQRHGQVGGLLEDVAGEHAEAAGVDGQRPVDGVLRAEEGGRRVVGDRRALERLLGERRVELLLQLRERAGEGRVLGRLGEPRGVDLLQQAHRVGGAGLPALGVERGEQLRAAGRPGPAVVVGDLRERGERLGKAGSEGGGRRGEVCGTGVHGRVCYQTSARGAVLRRARGGAAGASSARGTQQAGDRPDREPLGHARAEVPGARRRLPRGRGQAEEPVAELGRVQAQRAARLRAREPPARGDHRRAVPQLPAPAPEREPAGRQRVQRVGELEAFDGRHARSVNGSRGDRRRGADGRTRGLRSSARADAGLPPGSRGRRGGGCVHVHRRPQRQGPRAASQPACARGREPARLPAGLRRRASARRLSGPCRPPPPRRGSSSTAASTGRPRPPTAATPAGSSPATSTVRRT